ncbi:hypothetical protein MGYG_05313 [Nannizzia gypsea CBS 118893]|uniref:LysM domain-containing protein n=1 Tax=Arthroderma gypseum (strain ATCC MYA-4604 / CBS 118893) TaxID=535722 RepID=E4UVI9_ARTGP|nr:hypothetical protein MGYG_05313 [Nannizzia gypsea CBS 118893]EFR02316.1 hypothetical protein MGYG_05313 [Nannizzia gypsea CBS 118893]
MQVSCESSRVKFLHDDTLDSLCKTPCLAELELLRASIQKACTGDVMVPPWGAVYPATYIIDRYIYATRLSCLRDKQSGQYCQTMIANWANDKNASAHACSNCELGIQRIRLSSPFGYNDEEAAAFSSLTSSCGAEGYKYEIPAQYAQNWIGPFPDRSCDHSEITAEPNDTCISISGSHSVSTYHLIQENAMDFACRDLPRRSHYLCLPLHCKTHQLGITEDCHSLAEDFNITMTELLDWNPMINSNCTNLDSWRGWHLCKSSPTSTVPYREDGSLKRPERKLPAPPKPSPRAPGTIEGCYRYENAYEDLSALEASLNDCDFWAQKGEVEFNEFLAWNPSLRWGADCSLKPGYRYCIRRWEVRPTLPYFYCSEPNPRYIPSPSIPQSECSCYLEAGEADKKYLECSEPGEEFNLSLSEMRALNPWIPEDCKEDTFTSRYSEDGFLQLCMGRSNPDPSLPLPTSTQPDATRNCKEWHIVSEDDTCQSITEKYRISLDEFSSWNRGTGMDCSILWVGYGVCIEVSK